jgi:hypothetical protein
MVASYLRDRQRPPRASASSRIDAIVFVLLPAQIGHHVP